LLLYSSAFLLFTIQMNWFDSLCVETLLYSFCFGHTICEDIMSTWIAYDVSKEEMVSFLLKEHQIDCMNWSWIHKLAVPARFFNLKFTIAVQLNFNGFWIFDGHRSILLVAWWSQFFSSWQFQSCHHVWLQAIFVWINCLIQWNETLFYFYLYLVFQFYA
jgi:hypothetical protein